MSLDEGISTEPEESVEPRGSNSPLFVVDFFASGAQHNAGTIRNADVLNIRGFTLSRIFGPNPILKVPHNGMGNWDMADINHFRRDHQSINGMRHNNPAKTTFIPNIRFAAMNGSSIAPPQQTEYGIIQSRVTGREVRESDFEVESIRKAMRAAINEAVKYLVETGRGVDHLGIEALKKLPKFAIDPNTELGVYNVLLNEGITPTLIDTGLLEPERVRWWAKHIISLFPWLQYELISLVLHPYEKKNAETEPRHFSQSPKLAKILAEIIYQFTRFVHAYKKILFSRTE